MMNYKTKKRITASILLIILSGMLLSLFAPLTVKANAEQQVITEQMVLQFGTSVIKTSSRNDGILDSLQIVLRYQAYPQRGSPSDYPIKQVVINNGQSTTFTENLPVTLTGADNNVYVGNFSYTVFYDTQTSQLRVNGTDVAIGSKILLDASVYPEAFVHAAVVPVGMTPSPFSRVKAIRSSTPGYVEEFNNRINGEIQETIVLTTDRYGVNVQTNTKLSMYISYWQRQPDGTYDKTQEQTRVQVIFSAADFLNGRASSDGWDGTQYYQQIVPIETYTAVPVMENLQTSTVNRIVYLVQDRTSTSYSWGFNGVAGAFSSVINGPYTSTSSTTRLGQNYYRYTRYRIECSNFWRTSFAYAWSNREITTASGVSGGDAFCASNTSQPYFRRTSTSETTDWVTQVSMTGYRRTHTGHTYQMSIATPVWGSTYETTTRPSDTEIILGGKRIIRQELRGVPVFTDVNRMSIGVSSIGVANMLTEGMVNVRVSSYTYGLANYELLSGGNMGVDPYYFVLDATADIFAPTAVSSFKEGNYWGLYLYQSGHWRAVEVPISWYSINTMANRPVQLTWTDTVIPLDPDTDVSLADFGYVQSVFNQVKQRSQQKTITQIQSDFMSLLRADTNKAARKAVLYYDSLVLGGQTPSRAFETISRDFNLNLITK